VEAETSPKRTRGPNKKPPWSRDPEGEVAVLRLALDTSDPLQRRRLEGVFEAAFSLRRALQRDVRSRLDAYESARNERARGADDVRRRLGLSREALERAAYRHLDRAPHLRVHATKAVAMHLADSVWAATERHLFPDARGQRLGKPSVGRWYRFTRIPGRARSHTRRAKWETFRLHGTLAGHRSAYTGAGGRFFQPRSMRPVAAPEASWWSHEGPLVVVFTGLDGGDLVLPVRLPASPCNQAILDHFLGEPERWHKVDLVRSRDQRRGWRYEAHLMVLSEPYASPSTVERRVLAAGQTAGRKAGIDVNVSNVTVASHEDGQDLRISRIEKDAGQGELVERRAAKRRRRERALERSRRAANPDQYDLSSRQRKHVRRLAEAGRPPPAMIPGGPRKSRSDGKPLRAFWKDRLSRSYRRGRAVLATQSASSAQAKRDKARFIAKVVVWWHGFLLAVEACNLANWALRWGRSLHAFSPGTLLTAIEREAVATASQAGLVGGLLRASTATGLSQHCLCGRRVEKTLADRLHRCPQCGLIADRDAVSAALAAHLVFAVPGEPRAATVDYAKASVSLTHPAALRTLRSTVQGRQDAPTESTAPTDLGGFSTEETRRTPSVGMAARRIVGMAPHPTPDEPGHFERTTPDRMQLRTDLSRDGGETLPALRDSS
jgi:hypothetical protein